MALPVDLNALEETEYGQETHLCANYCLVSHLD